MKNTETFEIFGTDHVLTILFILVISLLIPYLLKNKTRESLYTFTSLLATVMIVNEFGKAFYYPYLYPDRYEFFEMNLTMVNEIARNFKRLEIIQFDYDNDEIV